MKMWGEPVNERDLWNERYHQGGQVWGAAPNQFVADRLVEVIWTEFLEPAPSTD